MMWCFFHFDVKLMFLFVEMMCVRTVVVLLFEYSSSQSSYGFVENVLSHWRGLGPRYAGTKSVSKMHGLVQQNYSSMK